MTDAPELLLANHLKTLRLPTFLREHDKLARICAAQGVDHVRYLARLTELELIDRERRMVERRIKSAKFPECATGLIKEEVLLEHRFHFRASVSAFSFFVQSVMFIMIISSCSPSLKDCLYFITVVLHSKIPSCLASVAFDACVALIADQEVYHVVMAVPCS
jgi:hypothetical protein